MDKLFGKIKDKAKSVKQSVADWWAPSADEVRVRDVAREVPGATAKTIGDIIRSVPRAILSTALTVSPKKTKEVIGDINPEEDFGKTGKFLLGDERIKTIPMMGKETLEGFGVSEEKAKTYGPLAGIGLTALDLYPGTSGKGKGVSLGVKELKTLRTLKEAPEVFKVLTKAGIDESVAKEVAGDIAKTTKTGQIREILGNKGITLAEAGKGAGGAKTGTKEGVKEVENAKVWLKKREEALPKWEAQLKKQEADGLTGPAKRTKKEINWLKKEIEGYKNIIAKVARETPKKRIAGYLKNNEPKLYERLSTRARKSGFPGQAGSVEGDFIQEQLDYLYPTELVQILKQKELPPSVGDILKGRGDDIVPPKSTERPPLKPKKDERRFITRTRALEPNLDEYLKGAKDTRSTEELVQRADELIKTNLDEAKNIAKTQTDDFAVAVASRLIDKKVLEARAIKDIGRKNELWDEVAEIANETARNLTEHGRAIQASIILGRMTPEGMVRFASRQIQKHNQMVDQLKNNPLKKTLSDMFSGQGMRKSLKKIPELDGKEAQEIADEMEKITKIADEVERARAFQKLNEKIASRIPSSLYEKIVTVWKAGLLTGVKTSGLNILSNISHSASEVIKDVPGALVDRIVSLFTGKRALVATTKGVGKGAKTGVAKGWDYLKTGFDERDIGTKLDYRKVNFGKSKLAKAIQTYEESVFRLLGSEDQPFYYGAKARSLYSQAIAKAKNAGLKGKEAKTFIDNLVENPTDDMIKYATLDAETAVFQNKTTLGQMAKAVQNLPGGQIVLPFGKTPSAVATQILNYSPVGIVKTIAKNVGKGKFDQRLFSQGLGRGLTGTAVLWLGTQLFNNDMVSTSYPISEKERKQWELEGRQANSIKINGKWRNAGVLGPAGLLLVIGGHMQEGINDTGSFTGGLAQASGGVGSTLTDQTFLRGINQTIEAIQDPQRSFSGWASSLAGSIIPTLVADISRSTDRYERRAPTPATRIASRLPGTRQTLEPKIDTFGKEIETPDFFTAMFDPTRPTQPTADANDPVVRELKRLREAGYPATPTQLGPNKGYESLTPKENTYLYQISGRYARRAIEDIIETSAYKGADDEMKEKLIGDAVNRSRVESRARALLRFTRGLRGRELAEKIRNLRDEKLVTDSVYGYYLKLKQ